MTGVSLDSTISAIADLLTYYVDSEDLSKEQLLDNWLRTYPVPWVRLALIEALHQGRYKTISVAQLLAFWQRRGEPVYHFNHDFEVLVSKNLPRIFIAHQASQPAPEPISALVLDDPELDPTLEDSDPDRWSPLASHAGAGQKVTANGSSEDQPFAPWDVLEVGVGHPEVTLPFNPEGPNPDSSFEFATDDGNGEALAIATSPPLAASLPIIQFTPSSDPSVLYGKLAAILQSQ